MKVKKSLILRKELILSKEEIMNLDNNQLLKKADISPEAIRISTAMSNDGLYFTVIYEQVIYDFS